MKVYIPNALTDVKELKGKALFSRRLAIQLRHEGVDITWDANTKADISLNLIRIKHQRSKHKILRFDGVWHNTGQNYIAKNRGMSEDLKKADGIVYQSEFSRMMCDRYLGTPTCPVSVIYNGSDPNYYYQFPPLQITKAGANHGHMFLAFSKWRPHKRLKDIIESFLLAELKNSILVVAGNYDKCGIDVAELNTYFSRPNIVNVGMVEQWYLAGLLRNAVASLHLCWFDACPNSVVEAIVAGVPVITNNVGGTWEIVKPSGGYVCDIDQPYDGRPVDLYHPPPIDRWLVAEALNECLQDRPKISCDHVHIKNVAAQYMELFEWVSV